MNELLRENIGSVLILTLNRPEKRNALNDVLIEALKGAFRSVAADETLRAVVVRGAGKDFCSGADLSALQTIAESDFEENLADARSLAELFTLMRNCPVPVDAAVHGRALARGCGLATGCDIVLAAVGSRFGYPEVKIGFVPAIVSAILRRNVSEKRAFEMLTQGSEFSAEYALEIGLINKIFPLENFDESVAEYISVYEKTSRSAVELTKQLLYKMDGLEFDHALDEGSQINAKARMTEDCKKGIAKFLDRA
jgi:methylglutaconyl-CoA hydratase